MCKTKTQSTAIAVLHTLTGFVLCCVLCGGCSRKTGGEGLARVGRTEITAETFRERVRGAPGLYQGYLATPAGRRQFMELIVREKIVLEAARRAGAEKTPEFRARLNEFKAQQKRQLADQRENLIMTSFLRGLRASFVPSDADVDAYYEQRRPEYDRPRATTVRHILVNTRQEAERVLERLQRGEDISVVARELSTDSISAARGGEIGPFKAGELDPAFESAVTPLRIGQISGVIETPFGFHVIKKTAEHRVPAPPIAETKASIRQLLEKGAFDRWVEKTRAELGVSINETAVAALRIDASGSVPPVQEPNVSHSQGGAQ